ncbi:hypothetical protein [Prevotella sp.]
MEVSAKLLKFPNTKTFIAMNTYNFYQDQKITCWDRIRFEIKARSYEDAIDIIKSWKGEDVIFMEDCKQVFISEFERLYDTSERVFPKDNGGQSTIETFDYTGVEVCNNTDPQTWK